MTYAEALDKFLTNTPFGKVTSRLEGTLGKLEIRDRILINGIYAISTAGMGFAVYSLFDGEPKLAGAFTAINAMGAFAGYLHHSAMGQKNNQPKTE